MRARLAVIGSVLVHGVVIAAAYHLPVPRALSRTAVEFEIHRREAPVVAPITPPIVEERKLVASAAVKRRGEAPAPAVKAVPLQPMETVPKSSTPDELSPQATVPERKGPPSIDLTLHGLPSTGEWATGPTVAPPRASGPPPDKAYKPRGDAGDPILGKLKEKTDDYPLESLGRDGYLYKGPQFSAHISMDGSVSFDDKIIRDFKGLSGGFDVTDWIMKGKKQDPYRYEKEKFLKYTQKKRDELARKAHEANMENSLAELPFTCDDIWRQRGKTAVQRRKALYELWRDVEDTDAGSRAREVIVEYVRRHLPAGSAEAYTDEELAMYNTGGRNKFEPYR